MQNLAFQQLPEMDTEGNEILQNVVQILNYLCGTPTLNRQTIAADVMGVATTFLKMLNDRNQIICSLKKELSDVREVEQNGNNRVSHDEAIVTVVEQHSVKAQVDEPKKEPLVGLTIMSPDAEFKVEAVLGRGVSAIVAKCWKKPSNEMVALKIHKKRGFTNIAEEEEEMMEYLRASGCEYNNIVSFTSSFMFDDHFCMEFKLLDTNLWNIMRDMQFLPTTKIRPILQQAAVALRFLKNVEVVHTDLKPDNIMLVDHCKHPLKIQLIDFGLAVRDPEELTALGFQALWYRCPEIVLGAPFNQAIDMWSLGCIAAELLMGAPLFQVDDETELMEYVTSLVGQPSDRLLDSGCHTEQFFYKRTSGEQPLGWTLKSSGESRPEMDSTERTECVRRKLLHYVKAPIPVQTDDYEAFEKDRVCFIDLLMKMLNPDPSERCTPEDILSHPFITMEHLDPKKHGSYVKSSLKHMEVCNNYVVAEEEVAQQPPCRSYSPFMMSHHSSTSTHSVDVQKVQRSGEAEEKRSRGRSRRRRSSGRSRKREQKVNRRKQTTEDKILS